MQYVTILVSEIDPDGAHRVIPIEPGLTGPGILVQGRIQFEHNLGQQELEHILAGKERELDTCLRFLSRSRGASDLAC